MTEHAGRNSYVIRQTDWSFVMDSLFFRFYPSVFHKNNLPCGIIYQVRAISNMYVCMYVLVSAVMNLRVP